jgi:hypothetical protein
MLHCIVINLTIVGEERRRCTDVILQADWSDAAAGRLSADGAASVFHMLYSSQNHIIGLV